MASLMAFCDWLLSVSVLFLRFMKCHVSTSFIFIAKEYPVVWGHRVLFVRWLAGGVRAVSALGPSVILRRGRARTSPCRRVFTSLGWMPRSGIAGSDDNAASTILWGHATLPKQFCCFSSHHPRLTVPVSHVLTGKCPFHSSHPRGREWRYLAAVSICIALMANHVEHLGMCLLAIYIHIFFGERSFQILYTFKIFITCLFVMELQDFLYILVIYQICDLQTFSLFQGLPFYFL